MSAPVPAPTVAWALFGWRGRIGRQPYILGQLLMLALFAFVLARVVAVEGDETATAFWGLVLVALLLASMWSSLAMTVKRLHDLGYPGALALLLFVAPVNLVMVVALMILPTHPATNAYGPPPS